MRNRRGKAKMADAHARVYRWEWETPAYQTLTPAARALLLEFRMLYRGRENEVYLSVREIERRIHVAQRRAQNARDELIERGWIRILEPGGFTRKTRHATVYALTNEPLEQREGSIAPKDYMRWRPK